VGGRKLVGLSQLRRKPGTLLQAGIHLDFDRELLAKLVLTPEKHRARLTKLLQERATALQEVVQKPNLTAQTVVQAVEKELNNLQNLHIAGNANL
jgi:lipoate---protein ligase